MLDLVRRRDGEIGEALPLSALDCAEPGSYTPTRVLDICHEPFGNGFRLALPVQREHVVLRQLVGRPCVISHIEER